MGTLRSALGIPQRAGHRTHPKTRAWSCGHFERGAVIRLEGAAADTAETVQEATSILEAFFRDLTPEAAVTCMVYPPIAGNPPIAVVRVEVTADAVAALAGGPRHRAAIARVQHVVSEAMRFLDWVPGPKPGGGEGHA